MDGSVSAETRKAVGAYLKALQDYLAPGDQSIIAMRIEALLSHWSVPERPEAIQDIVAGDWVRVIGSFPGWTVIEAANHWLEVNDRKPTIAAIKQLCDEAVYEARLRLKVLLKIEGAACLPETSRSSLYAKKV